MKKIIYILLFIIIVFGYNNVYAYKKDSYQITIPSNYEKVDGKDLWEYKNTDEVTSISIIVDDNSNNLNFEDYNENELEKNEYIKEIENKFKEINKEIDVTFKKISFVNVNDTKAIKMDIESNYIESKKYNSDVYQTEYVIASKNYVYYIIVSSSKKENIESNEIKSMINSFKSNDYKAKKDESMIKYYLSIAIILALGGLVLSISIKRKHSRIG